MVGHNDIVFNRYTWKTGFDQLQLFFYDLAAKLSFYRNFGRSKPLPYRYSDGFIGRREVSSDYFG